MATNTAGTAARKLPFQVAHTIAFDVSYADAGIASGVNTGKILPAGAIITSTSVLVATTFNAQSTNVLTVGTNTTTANNMVASGDVDETTAGLTNAIKPTGTALGKLSADSPIYVKYTQTGTAATQGAATVIVHYVPHIS